MRVVGRVTGGLGEGRFFTGLDWVRRQVEEKLGFTPYPGTLNLVVPAEEARWLAERARVVLEPPDASWCRGYCLPVRVGGHLPGALVFAEASAHPPERLEVMAAVHLRRTLGLADGDAVELEVTEERGEEAGR